MQITLKPVDLLAAVRDYVQKNLTVAKGKQIDVTFKAGRNGNGTTAFVDIIDDNTPVTVHLIDISDEVPVINICDETPVETGSTTDQSQEPVETAQIDLEEVINEADNTNAMETVDETDPETEEVVTEVTEEAEETPPADTGPVSIFGDKG